MPHLPRPAALSGGDFGQPVPAFETCGDVFIPIIDICHMWNVRAQPDGKLIASGPVGNVNLRLAVSSEPSWLVARLGADGERDPSWQGNGVRKLTIDGLTPHYLCVLTRPGRMDELTVQVEAASASSTGSQRAAMARELATRVKDRVGVTIRVEVLEPHALERSLGKAKRISDQRDLR